MFEVFRKAYRRVVSYLLAAAMVLGIFALPNAVLCAAPGGHFAVELMGVSDCPELASAGLFAPLNQLSAHCPLGCHDTPLNFEIQYDQNTNLPNPSAAILTAVLPIPQAVGVLAYWNFSPPHARSQVRELRTTVILL